MRFQTQKSSCGPAALAAALSAYGILRTEEELAQLAKTTTAGGTDWKHMLSTLRTVQKSHPEICVKPFEEGAEVGLLRLLRALDDGRPVVIIGTTEKPWDHYMAVVGRLGDRVCLFDPGSNEAFTLLTIQDFMARWKGPDEVKRQYCGIII